VLFAVVDTELLYDYSNMMFFALNTFTTRPHLSVLSTQINMFLRSLESVGMPSDVASEFDAMDWVSHSERTIVPFWASVWEWVATNKVSPIILNFRWTISEWYPYTDGAVVYFMELLESIRNGMVCVCT